MSRRSKHRLHAVLQLRELILAGEFPPGARIAELTVVAKLGISRTPVRLALATLEHEGLLEISSSGGFVVREFSASDVRDGIELRGVLEGTAARFAAERHSGAQSLQALRSAVAGIESLLAGAQPGHETLECYIDLNGLFHGALLDLAASAMLRRSLEQVIILPFASPNAFLLAHAEGADGWRSLQLGQEHHRALLEAVELREGARAEALGREHARLARRNLNMALERQDGMSKLKGAALVREDPLRAESYKRR